MMTLRLLWQQAKQITKNLILLTVLTIYIFHIYLTYIYFIEQIVDQGKIVKRKDDRHNQGPQDQLMSILKNERKWFKQISNE